jgi:hypothetical protein
MDSGDAGGIRKNADERDRWWFPGRMGNRNRPAPGVREPAVSPIDQERAGREQAGQEQAGQEQAGQKQASQELVGQVWSGSATPL